MIKKFAGNLLSERQKRTAKSVVSQARQAVTGALRSYGKQELLTTLQEVGVSAGDTIMVHVNFPNQTGFDGTPADMADVLVESVGDDGNLLMVSIPFRGSAYDHLEKGKVFDVQRTISMMGLVTEMFRRRSGTVRSLHPTHPVLASGPAAADIVSGHADTIFPCGAGSPLEALQERGGKLLFVDVPFGAITFFHYLEDYFKDKIDVPVYEDREFSARVIDEDGIEHIVKTLTFRRRTIRDTDMLRMELANNGKISTGQVGTTSLELVGCGDAIEAMKALIERGEAPVRAE